MTKNLRYYSGNCIKILVIITLILTSIMFTLGEIGAISIPSYKRFSNFDVYFWVSVMTIQAGILSGLLFCKGEACYKCNNFILSTSGLSLMVVGGMFGFEYPPYSWQMTLFPFVGFLIIVAGRSLNKRG